MRGGCGRLGDIQNTDGLTNSWRNDKDVYHRVIPYNPQPQFCDPPNKGESYHAREQGYCGGAEMGKPGPPTESAQCYPGVLSSVVLILYPEAN